MKSIIKQLYTILLVTVACLTVTGCSDDFKSGLRLDGDVWVNSIRLDEYAGTVDYQNKAIVVGVPYDYDITRMVVTEMNLSEGAKASIAIGETIDFSLPVSLTVKNGDVQMSYTITVKRDEAKILTFKLNDTYVGKVDQLSKTISVVVPLTVDITQLKGTFTVTDGATVTPASGSIYEPRHLHGNLPFGSNSLCGNGYSGKCDSDCLCRYGFFRQLSDESRRESRCPMDDG